MFRELILPFTWRFDSDWGGNRHAQQIRQKYDRLLQMVDLLRVQE